MSFLRKGIKSWNDRTDDVTLNTLSDWTWIDDGALLSVSVHEFGHALGLNHVQDEVIMNPITWGLDSRYGTYELTTHQSDDLNGVNALY